MPKNKIREKQDYQKYIIDYLVENNHYIQRQANLHYDIAYAMDTELLRSFLEKTQKKTMDKLSRIHKNELDQFLIKTINQAINNKGNSLLHVFKHGVEIDPGTHIDLMYRKPANSYNEDLNKKYQSNIFSVIEEVNHKQGERIDLVIFLNGIAIISIELKANTSGQTVEDAILQYMNNRDPRSRLLKYRTGTLVNFAMDFKKVFMTTHLNRKKTVFLPFNKGAENGGSGNPHNDSGYNVSYMWEDILTKDSLLQLIDKFIFFDLKQKYNEETGKINAKETLIFPRYHQLNTLRKLEKDIISNRTDCNYLIQHSAGSGKTYTIAWLAHRLVSLHGKDDINIFDSILIITDRIVIDRQLQDAILSIEHKEGLIKVMDETCTSNNLAEAINGNTKIIVSTIQKFRYITDIVSQTKGKKFAIIIDEAHQSTTGKNMAAVSTSISADNDNYETAMDAIEAEMNRSGKQQNASVIAFTATPKATMLQLFGKRTVHGSFEPFDTYSMRQAIEEGFILDVLSNYTTYKTLYEINKTIENDPELDSDRAKRKITRFTDLHPVNITQKIEIIIEHFRQFVSKEMAGKAKAMVVTSSREAAVKYKKEFERYISEKGYENIKALVAFSGKIKLKNDENEYTEINMNSLPENNLVRAFDSDEYQVLLVANKYQTGFDQPKLQTMYVDKKLRSVSAVQTLSRLNRKYKGKEQVFVLDFKNEYEDIIKAFEPYYEGTILANTINVHDINKLLSRINGYGIVDYDTVLDFNELIYLNKITIKEKRKIESLLDRSIKKISSKKEEKQFEIFQTIKSFIRMYEFLIQATSFKNEDVHKKYNYLSFLIKEINIGYHGRGFNIEDKIEIVNFRQKKIKQHITNEITANQEISLPNSGIGSLQDENLKRLSEIIIEMNREGGHNFNSMEAVAFIHQIELSMTHSEELKTAAKNNNIQDFSFVFNNMFDEYLVEGVEKNEKLCSTLLKNGERKAEVTDTIKEGVYKKLREKAD